MTLDVLARRAAFVWTIASLMGATACGGASAPPARTPASVAIPTPPEEPALDGSDCRFTAPDVPATHAEDPSEEARVAFEGAVAAGRDGRLEDAREGFARALSIDATFSLAAYALGATLVELERDDEAVLAFQRVLASDPSSIDALYNLGVLHYAHGEFADALGYFQRAYALGPAELDIAKKVTQSLLALDRFDEAALVRRDVRRIRACSTDEDVRSLEAIVIDVSVSQSSVATTHVAAPDSGRELRDLSPASTALRSS